MSPSLPHTEPPPGDGFAPDQTPGAPKRGLRSAWWLIPVIVVLAWNVVLFVIPAGGAPALTYSDFRAQVAAGNVSSVDISGQTVTGTLRTPATSTAAASTTAAAGQASTATSVDQAIPFQAVIPPFGDADLLPALIAQRVAVTAEDTTSAPGIIPDIIGTLLPMLLLGGLFWWGLRRARRAGGGILGFGGSKPRVYTADRPKVTFADVAGEEDAKGELREIVDYLKDRTAFDLVGARLPRGVLLVGPPGTGKTLLARAVAGEAHVPFFSISGSEFVEMFVGVGASRVRDLFAKAKAQGPAIIFVDEIDAVGRRRSSGPMSNDEREQTLNQLLVEMDGFDDQTRIVVIGATNRPDVLDPALHRPGRFDREITVGYPDRDGREAILRIHARAINLAPSVDLAEVARQAPGLSGADLANLANEAALQAARAGRGTVEAQDFSAAMDRITLGTRQPSLRDPHERRLVAYHESGHAIVATVTPGADPVDKVTIVPHGRSLGATRQVPDEERRNYPLDLLQGRLAVLLGGRAAEELVFGQPTTGAESDLREATRIARQMVGAWGMSSALGPVSFGIDDPTNANPFRPDYAEATATRLDDAVRELLEAARRTATDLLVANRAALDALATELLTREVVNHERLEEITSGLGVASPEAGAGEAERRVAVPVVFEVGSNRTSHRPAGRAPAAAASVPTAP